MKIPLLHNMRVKNPDGKERELPALTNHVAQAVLDEAKKAYDVAERYRDKDWSAYSSQFYRAARIENAAIEVQKAMTC